VLKFDWASARDALRRTGGMSVTMHGLCHWYWGSNVPKRWKKKGGWWGGEGGESYHSSFVTAVTYCYA
jgi:hypothetical protein